MIPGSQALLIRSSRRKRRRYRAGHLVDHHPGGADLRRSILGGYIADNYHWGWIFLINVPVGLAVTFLLLEAI